MLIANNNLINQFTEKLKDAKVHAIYEPNGDGAFGDCYCAAVDLFDEGYTFRVYFMLDELQQIDVRHVERWFFG